jgi:4'-phosphopantetheinyl transferase
MTVCNSISLPTGCLGKDEVHVWSAWLGADPLRLCDLETLLSKEERNRANQFYFVEDRNRFITGRGLLRTILSRYLKEKPEGLQFQNTYYGKPKLDPTIHPRAALTRFNLAHSKQLVLFALANEREIGIDVEYVRNDVDVEALVTQFFARNEAAKLRSLPAFRRHEAFFRCWTRKEAYIKARGEGLSMPLDRFEVSFLPDEPVALLKSADDANEVRRWSIKDIAVGPEYMAALAVEGHELKFKEFEWR